MVVPSTSFTLNGNELLDHLSRHLEVWERKRAVRKLYSKWFTEIRSYLAPGPTLEIGSGIGRLKEVIPSLLRTDVRMTPWTDLVMDGQILPFKSQSIGNLILIDVLHHLPRPVLFFAEAARTLSPGGRIIIVEPYVSPISRIVYRLFHPEPIDMRCDPFDPMGDVSSDHPMDANQAIATLMFFKRSARWNSEFPPLRINSCRKFSFLSYPGSGGFGHKQFLPTGVILLLDKIEPFLLLFSSILAFRAFVVLQNQGSPFQPKTR